MKIIHHSTARILKGGEKCGHLVTTTMALSMPAPSIALRIGLPPVPPGSPSSLNRYLSPTYAEKIGAWWTIWVFNSNSHVHAECGSATFHN